MQILLSGASGFLGTALRARLARKGHQVRRLVRRPPIAASEFGWDPARRQLDHAALDEVGAVVNLSGAGIASRPWTRQRKRVLLSSRVDPTATLAEALAGHADRTGQRPVLLQASGIAWYGTTSGSTPHREGEPAGRDWLAQVCVHWEQAADPVREAGLRVCELRTSPVLDPSGGMLAALRLPFGFGLGARLGDGHQHMAMISLADWLAAVEFLLSAQEVSGPVNLTLPEPTTNVDFTQELARALHRPAVLTAPAPLLGLLGELSGQLLGDQHVVPAALTEAGFRFAGPDVASAVALALAGVDP